MCVYGIYREEEDEIPSEADGQTLEREKKTTTDCFSMARYGSEQHSCVARK